MRIFGYDDFPGGDGDDELSDSEIRIALSSIGYQASEEPGYEPKLVRSSLFAPCIMLTA